MAIRKPKTVEVTLRVRVPKHWSAARTKHEISESWYGEVYPYADLRDDREDPMMTLHPRWTKARVVKKERR